MYLYPPLNVGIVSGGKFRFAWKRCRGAALSSRHEVNEIRVTLSTQSKMFRRGTSASLWDSR